MALLRTAELLQDRELDQQKMYIHSFVGTVFINEIPALDELLERYIDEIFEKADEFKVRMAAEEKAE